MLSSFVKKILLVALLFFVMDSILSFFLLKGINQYYGFEDDSELLINGSSMSMSGFNRDLIENQTGIKTAFYAKEGVNIEERLVMLQHYFSEHPNTVKTVIYEINPLLFSGHATADNVYTTFYSFIDNAFIKKYIRDQADPTDYFIHKWVRSTRYDAQLIVTSLRGYFGSYENYKAAVIGTQELKVLNAARGAYSIGFNKDKIRVFEESIQLIKRHHAKVILVMMPMVYEKSMTFDQEGLKVFENYFLSFSRNQSIRYVNFNLESISRNTSLFSDPVHLNINGQTKLTNMIVDSIKNKE